MIRFTNSDGQPFSVKDYEFKLTVNQQKIGDITVGGLRTGDCMTHDLEGIHFRYQDGTKYFISWSWFDYDGR